MGTFRIGVRTLMLVTSGALVALTLGGCAQEPGAAAVPTDGAKLAAASAAPAAQVPLILLADTVLGGKNLTAEEKPEKSCVQVSRFARNEEIVWRVKIIDPATGLPMDDKSLSSVELRLPDSTAALKFGPHPKNTPTDSFWTASWDVPASYPTGALPYTIVATAADGRTGTYEQFKSTPSLLTITNQVRTPLAG